MDAYLIPIRTAAWVFPLLALVITLPFALYQYHRYGFLPWVRTLVLYSFVFYLLTAYFLVILPLPDRAAVASGAIPSPQAQPIPFNDLFEYAAKNGFPRTFPRIKAFLTSFTFWQLAFNILLVFPFGVYLRYYFRCGWKRTLLFSFCLSLFFELTQLSGLYGIYAAPYRTFDADDLLCNTLGGLTGWLLAPACIFFLPRREQLDAEARKKSVRVTLFRRACATVADAFLVGGVLFIVSLALWVLAPAALSALSARAVVHLPPLFFLFLWLCTVRSHGFTPGKALCRLRIVRADNGGAPGFWRLTARYLLVGFQLDGWLWLAESLMTADEGKKWLPAPLGTALVIVLFLFCLYFWCETLRRLFGRRKPYFYERVSGTACVSVFDAAAPAGQPDAAKQAAAAETTK